jgi:D-alanine-D-alanine ligase
MGTHPGPPLNDFRELRILVLHNRDFDQDSQLKGGHHHSDPEFISRADVVNAARDVARALAARGHFVEIQGTDRDDIPRLLSRLQADRPDLVFNLCESLGGDSRHEVVVPALLDMLGIPYTGSGPLALGVSLRKDRAKDVLRAAGVPTPAAAVLSGTPQRPEDDLQKIRAARLDYPLIVKPTREDASVGICAASVVHDDEALCERVIAMRHAHRQPLLVEQYIVGRELYVSLLGNRPAQALPMHEIDFSLMPSGLPHIVCYEAKWDPGSPKYAGTKPRQAQGLGPQVVRRIEEAARAAFLALDLSDYGRCDVRLSEGGTPYIIDVNPNCDLSDGAGFSLAARFGGLGYDEVIERIAAAALHRSRHDHAESASTPSRSEWPPLHVLDPAGAEGGPAGPAGARVEGRAVLPGRGQLRPRTHRQRAL